jgi:predicted pyridoxine 5'-phosphate oxidase superfamily flavin-nucleotide-binding protein
MKERIPDEIKQFFETIPIMAFSTVDKNGTPNVVPIASKKIVNDDTILVIDAFFKKTKENILQNKNVSIAMWEGSKGYQIKGLSTYHSKDETFDEAKDWILKLKPNKTVKGVVKIKITDIYSDIYSITPTREEAGMRII